MPHRGDGIQLAAFLAVDEIPPDHEPRPVGLVVVTLRIGQLPHFAKGDRFSAGQGFQVVVVRLFVVAVIDVCRQYVDIFRTGIVVGIGAGFVTLLVPRGIRGRVARGSESGRRAVA